LEALLTLWVPFHAALILSTVVLSVLAAEQFARVGVRDMVGYEAVQLMVSRQVGHEREVKVACPGLERLFGTRKFAVSGLFPFSFFWRVHALTPFLAEDQSASTRAKGPDGSVLNRPPEIRHAKTRTARSRTRQLLTMHCISH
jgi:hypothetical protein